MYVCICIYVSYVLTEAVVMFVVWDRLADAVDHKCCLERPLRLQYIKVWPFQLPSSGIKWHVIPRWNLVTDSLWSLSKLFHMVTLAAVKLWPTIPSYIWHFLESTSQAFNLMLSLNQTAIERSMSADTSLSFKLSDVHLNQCYHSKWMHNAHEWLNQSSWYHVEWIAMISIVYFLSCFSEQAFDMVFPLGQYCFA